ncbi:ImmA/IrrE family metallo-endopeptidase [Caloranaerobacter sp. DY30410]|uniref:ImmA/IrrE family metallo-endopeptidase n=1 Tax=Caloranaerobacter sp. DY30410 TaxID=3238305 RepID=UPI003CFEF415
MTWIKDIVNGLIELYQTRNVYELLDALEIMLIKKELPSGEKGRFFRDIFNNEFIFISNNLTIEEEKIVIAHELGHLILHTNLSTSYYNDNHLLVKDKIEIEANKFAAELLIPDDIKICEGTTIQQLACYLGVTEELIKLKFGRRL